MIDVQGTLIDDREKKPIAGALEAVSSLKEEGVPFLLVTNNTKLKSEAFRSYLRSLGFRFDDAQYLDPLMVLENVLPPCKTAAYGTDAFLELLQARGYRLEYQRPDAVLVSIKEDFNNAEFAEMIEALLAGARLVGMHETSLYAKNGRRYPGVGAILKMLSFATGKEYTVVGKPSRSFYDEALRRLRQQEDSLENGEIVMISDDLIGDLKGAKEMGIRTALVLSGKIASVQEAMEAAKRVKPEWISHDIGEWFQSNKRGAA
ncbi:HAD-IIA family hydrolase [Hydrogenimonas sp.]